MAGSKGILKLMNIMADEARAVVMLIAFSFFAGLSLSFYFTASNTLFLRHFAPDMIPVSFIASGLLIYLSWLAFSMIDKRLGFRGQVTFKLAFVVVSVVLITAGVYLFPSSWLIFLTYTWVRIVVFITLVTFWGIAGKLFNLRQGKRIFGLITTGEVVSIIIGYFSIPLLMRFLKTPDLLLLASLTLFLCFVMAVWIMHAFRQQIDQGAKPAGMQPAKAGKSNSYLKLVRKPYFRYISLMALLPIFGYLFVDFIFLSQTKIIFAGNPESIAGFFGIFLGFVAVVELLLKLVSGRFLNKYGILPSLLSLPVMMLASVFVAALAGLFYGSTMLFFAFVALSRLFERSVRAAVYEPAFQLLYQPVEPAQRLVFQSQIEGIPKALGTMLTGLVIILFSWVASVNLVGYSWFFLPALAFWVWTSVKMYEAYRNTLKHKIKELDHAQAIPFSWKQRMLESLEKASPEAAQQLVRWWHLAQPDLSTPTLAENLTSLKPPIQQIVIQHFENNLITEAMPALMQLRSVCQLGVEDEKKLNQAIEVLTKSQHADMEELHSLAASTDREVRLRAARIAGQTARYGAVKLLQQMARDADETLRLAVLEACGKQRRIELWPLITDHLLQPRFSATAARAAVRIGEPVIGQLDVLYGKSAHKAIPFRIISIIAQIPGASASKWLRSKLPTANHDLRQALVKALSQRNEQPDEEERLFLEENISHEVEHILFYLASLNDLTNLADAMELKLSLMTAVDEEKEYIFNMLTLLYDQRTIRHIREFIESKDTTARVYALEMGEMTIRRELRELVFPVFEDASATEKLQRLGTIFPQLQLPVVQRLYVLLDRPYTLSDHYIKACALRLLQKLNTDDEEALLTRLSAHLLHPDALLAEAAEEALKQRAPDFYEQRMQLLHGVANSDDRRLSKKLPLMQQTSLLKNSGFFDLVPESKLVTWLNFYPEIAFNKTADSAPSSMSFENHMLQLMTGGYTISIPSYCFTEALVQLDGIEELVACPDISITKKMSHA